MKNSIDRLKGFYLEEGALIRSLLFSGSQWAVYETDASYNVFLVYEELLETWSALGAEAVDLFKCQELVGQQYYFVKSKKFFELAPVSKLDRPFNISDALSFASSFVKWKRSFPESDLGNSLYWESQSIILPLSPQDSRIDDVEIVLGMWLTGGVRISIVNFKRVLELASYMEPVDLAHIYNSLGYEKYIPNNYKYVMSKSKSKESDSGVEVNDESGFTSLMESGDLSCEFGIPGQRELSNFFNDHVIDIVKHPKEYSRMGVFWPPSFILYGDPGTGKSFAVELLAKYLDWPCHTISSKVISSPYIHETSKLISDVFDRAIATSPSILIVDELDSFLSDRVQGGVSGHHVEEVNEFLRRIPEANSQGVLVIGITNLLDLIDQAAIRKGRFDHIVKVSLPSAEERLEILQHSTAGIPIDADVSLKYLADKLEGCTPAELNFLVRDAGRLSVKRRKKSIDVECFNDAFLDVMKPKEKSKRRIGFV